MPMGQEILAGKGSMVHTVPAAMTVLEATRLMNQHKIGAVVVLEGGRVAGMFTERDVLSRVVAMEISPSRARIGEVMTRDIVCCEPQDDIDDVSRVMRDRRIRHLPVVNPQGELLGLISIGDINAYHASSQESQIHLLKDYVYGRA